MGVDNSSEAARAIDSSINPPKTDSPHPDPKPQETSPLSYNELYRLTLYKWRYAFEAFGFADREVKDLMFLKWLHASRKVLP